jgi:light-regulated signal transduction histidine kinase (bacteriophytochrome)
VVTDQVEARPCLQMTTNLVHNAIVHNLPEQGNVWITTSVHPKTVMLTVENTGEKLAPQLVATLVEPFQRGTERIRTDHPGVGLGLAIVKSITQAHDGDVTVQLPAAPPHICPACSGYGALKCQARRGVRHSRHDPGIANSLIPG